MDCELAALGVLLALLGAGELLCAGVDFTGAEDLALGTDVVEACGTAVSRTAEDVALGVALAAGLLLGASRAWGDEAAQLVQAPMAAASGSAIKAMPRRCVESPVRSAICPFAV
ncbi:MULTISPECIES: hypothetical protein [Glutamicibacter]|uniref:Uncharacterized protein n=1 Tax=Glutamicibacter halophytocola TaxID=1933880 RepID=A0AA95BTY2_9MICC|nr:MULTISPECIES: hypothetical protein [Glutamicibacter]MBF6671994.1 hypothetical protein [Glutamicibacter sp. FBE19]NQD41504.1 hypothetical protein [Glutamicibacter halophytocola]UUX59383.1 hypothetical protein NUH22_01700 [Glutamicibacter halophytocola]